MVSLSIKADPIDLQEMFHIANLSFCHYDKLKMTK
jgi:hypothetical protein